MIKKLLTLTALAAALPTWAATGTWASFVGIDADGAGSAATQWYDSGAFQANELTDFANANLGSFAQGSSAWLSAGDLFTFKNNGGNVTGATMYWRVDNGAYTAVQLNWNSNAPLQIPSTTATIGGNGDQSWNNTSINADFLQGLTAGNHQLQVYFMGSSNQGDIFAGSEATPMSANFTVTTPVPEPASMSLMLGGLALLGHWSRRKAKQPR